MGCMQADERTAIPPLPAMEGQADPGLGPGARAVSSGPGYKSAPSWAPEGGRIAFTMDGYVVGGSVDTDGMRRWTTRDFGAEEAEWTGENSLAILGSSPGGEPGAPRPLYRATYEEGSLAVEEVSTEIRAMSADAEAGTIIVAFEISPSETGLAVLRSNGEIERVFTSVVRGVVTGISPSPDGEEAVLAARAGGPEGPYDLYLFDLRSGEGHRVASLGSDQQLFGVPQWTEHGIYYVSGESGSAASEETALYKLYRVSADPEKDQFPEPAPGVGREFVAASVQASPNGKRLAVIGRLNPKSPINLYVLHLEAKDLSAVTTNEDMEIKTGPDDLDWSPTGDGVAIVARGVPSGEPAVRGAPAQALLEDFYNVYEIPVSYRETPR